MSDYDVIVFGGGHNGLTAAALLAKEGRKTLLLEKRDRVGGLAAGEEFHPGYRTAGILHDTGGVRGWVSDELSLADHGLSRQDPVPPTLVPQKDGEGLLLWRDAASAHAELSRLSADDAAAYADYRAFLARIAPAIGRAQHATPPDMAEPGVGDLLGLGRIALGLRRLGKKDMLEVMRAAPMSLADWLGERFDSQLLLAALAAPAIHHTYTGPRSPGGTANLLWTEATAEAPVAGGPAAVVAALEKAAAAFGAEIRTGVAVEGVSGGSQRVTGVRLEGGETIGADRVVAAVDPKQVFLELMPPAMVQRGLERAISSFRARGTGAKIHLALSDYPDFTSRPGLRASAIRIGETLEELEKAFDPVKYRRRSDRPILDIQVPTVQNPELAPDGHHVFSILHHFAPYHFDEGWTESARDALYESALDVLEEYAPGVRDLVVGHETLTPADLADRYSLSGGHLHHGEHALDQLLVRPVRECARHATPFRGLFLAGGGSFPGGGITCAPGALAARAALAG